MAAIVVEELRKSYGSLHAVRGVSFSVEPGEVFGLLGPNGAGKTTIVERMERRGPSGDADLGRGRGGGHTALLPLGVAQGLRLSRRPAPEEAGRAAARAPAP
jgi:ABC-type phosphonate transport system ATPase subunit